MSDYEKFLKQLREVLRARGLSNALIEELIAGNSVTMAIMPMPTPWPGTFTVERVYKDGKLQPVAPIKEDGNGKDETD